MLSVVSFVCASCGEVLDQIGEALGRVRLAVRQGRARRSGKFAAPDSEAGSGMQRIPPA